MSQKSIDKMGVAFANIREQIQSAGRFSGWFGSVSVQTGRVSTSISMLMKHGWTPIIKQRSKQCSFADETASKKART